MNQQQSEFASSAICHAAEMIKISWQATASEYERPSVVFGPSLTKDGNMWCALLGPNLHEGVAGFGDTPARAMWAFDAAWNETSGSHILGPKP